MVSGVTVFGPFRLRAAERTLEKNGVPLKIGSRALDILQTLIEHAPQIVSKRDLMARVWGRVVVEEGSLRFQIAALRKVLGDAESESGYIRNVPGRGYGFVAPVTSISTSVERREVSAQTPSAMRLPRRFLRLIGRDSVVSGLTRQLRERRFVSIVGPGGIGKTSVALAVAHEMLTEFPGGVYFLDLAETGEPELIASALASQLGVSVASEASLPAILSALGEQRSLLVLDSCEHVVDSIAPLAEELIRATPQLHLLITSRESLRAEGEWVHHLAPLQCPPRDRVSLTAAEALTFPGVQLFVEQVEASGYPLQLTDADAQIVADLCRRLDGIPLALELAARYVRIYGVKGTAALVDRQFHLLRGRRTAAARHQTLAATLDWSYGLLSEIERLVLRRLSIFVGAFSVWEAIAIVCEEIEATEATDTLARLVEKSLLSLEVGTGVRYRLLDTTRSYAAQKLLLSGELTMTARRHAECVSSALERVESQRSLPAARTAPDRRAVRCQIPQGVNTALT
jgi:predicted ATPase/DNA-binding winged helix-turn-helix (wHTH) protein